jgi:hypothetical protein
MEYNIKSFLNMQCNVCGVINFATMDYLQYVVFEKKSGMQKSEKCI